MEKRNVIPPVTSKRAGERAAGIIGAWFGALVGSIPMLISLLTVRSLAIPFAAIIPVASQYFYRKFSGPRKSRTAVVWVTVLSLVTLLFVKLAAESISLSSEPSWKAAAAEYGVKPLEFAWSALLITENFRLLVPSLLLSAAVCATGVVVVYPFIKDYADAQPVQTDESELNELRKKAENAAKKAAGEKVVKKKSLPQRLEYYASGDTGKKIVPKGEYRVSPAELQKKYLGFAAAAAIVLGLVLFAGCVYMTVNGSLQYVLFGLVCAGLCVVAVRVLFSLARYVEADGVSLKARGMAGKITEFTFDDITACERDDKRFYIIGKNGEMLAFFNLGWQNAKKLLNAMEGYGIAIPKEEEL